MTGVIGWPILGVLLTDVHMCQRAITFVMSRRVVQSGALLLCCMRQTVASVLCSM